MKTLAPLLLAASMIAASTPSAQAFPILAPSQAVAGAEVTLVAGGCGLGFHRGPFLGCRPNRVFEPRSFGFARRPIVCRVVGLIPHRVCRAW